MAWSGALVLIILVSAYLRLPLIIWSLLVGAGLFAIQIYALPDPYQMYLLWIIYAAVFIPLNLKPIRRNLVSRAIYAIMKKIMPTISQTEQEALDAGDVWWEAELFSGKPDFSILKKLPKPSLTGEEQAFLDGPVEEFCTMLDDWQITQEDYDLTPEAWQFAKDNGLFALIIPKQYGGKEYSAYLHSQAVMKIAGSSYSAAVTVMVPNSLGPGKLLMTYGTKEQKDYYLPRLASGVELPCFGLTGPDAGSDAGAMPDTGVVCYGSFEGKDNVLGIRMNWAKRYITLAPVATLLGIAFKLYDPEHLLSDEEDRGITLALIKRETEGVEIGRRHFPANQAFMNGPIRGKDVFIPLESIIGGVDYVGKGWSMLMECLGDGRAISLPALGTAGGKLGAKYTGAYARIRQQFHTPIGHFEGVEEALTQIAGQTYAMDAARSMVAVALDSGIVPSVISAIVKQQTMERMRIMVNLAMDIHGGHGICMGPHNHLGRGYQLMPVGITVEGANILTRTMIIFGQGAMRSHPYLLKEVQAVHNENQKQGVKDFDNAFFAHMGFIVSNVIRSFWFGLSYARFVNTPGDKDTSHYYRQLVKMSSAFALLADVCVAVLGGSLKRREKISGRLADALSNMYMMSAALKHYENQGSQKEDFILLKWVCEDSLFNIQTAMKGIMKNLPVPFIGAICNFIIFPLTKPYQQPNDKLGHAVARVTLSPSETLERLSAGVFKNENKNSATGRISHAFNLVLKSEDLQHKLRDAFKQSRISSRDSSAYLEAKEKNIISETEYEMLIETEAAIQNAIKVDEFSFSGWKIETP
ncbi:Acyl-coenzyme A dehydrogenase FadE [hydrothermal vent metagenome]|uniref:Acyl-coenzyme A dehydrogenase n=1 Tax=hydrothermal vent metagenome TaxID=652676 RepID=A0A3B0X8X9_9ZZZZ